MDAPSERGTPRASPGPRDLLRYALRQGWDPRHLGTVRRLLAPAPGERILEVGCGRGHLTRRLEALGAQVTGVDANPQAASAALAGDVRTMSVEALEFSDAHFDKVVSVHAIEHFPHLEQGMAEMARVLRPGGLMLLIYPAEPIRGLFAVPDAITIYRNPFRARDLHLHKLRPATVRALAAAVGLEHVRSEFSLITAPQFATVLRKPA
jgi:ubiquinone/menaquinone biosynthesis C-methylase UbiE